MNERNKDQAMNKELIEVSHERVAGLRSYLKTRVLGQEIAVDLFCDAIEPGIMGLTMPGKPRGIIMISGPSGTGKTMVVKEANQYLYGSDSLCRLDMANYTGEDAIHQLRGKDLNDEGDLGEGLRKLAEGGGRFILLDEIEKGHKKVSDLFLAMAEGRLVLASRRLVELSPYTIIVTSNLGAKELTEADESMPETTRKRVFRDAAKQHFKPEVLARFTETVMYKKLTPAVQVAVCRQKLDERLAFLESQVSAKIGNAHKIHIGEGVFGRLVSEGYDRELGARPMEGVIQKRAGNAVARALYEKRLCPGVTESVFSIQGTNGFEVRPLAGVVGFDGVPASEEVPTKGLLQEVKKAL